VSRADEIAQVIRLLSRRSTIPDRTANTVLSRVSRDELFDAAHMLNGLICRRLEWESARQRKSPT
jgi:hypothetical protein